MRGLSWFCRCFSQLNRFSYRREWLVGSHLAVWVLPERWVLGVEVRMRANRRQTERRRWSRLPLAIPVFVRSRDRKGKEFLEFATALNVSAGGMLVAIRRILPKPIALLSLEIPSAPVGLARRSAARTFRARTLRTTPADGCYLLGLKFSHPLPVSTKPLARPRKLVSSV
jgi:hypothetical protein